MEVSLVVQSRLIGAILVAKNLITGDQLERALQIQEETGDRLGEIVVAEFGVSRLELASVLAEQWSEHESAEKSAALEADGAPSAEEGSAPASTGVPLRRLIGEIFLELGFVSSEQIDRALDIQRETGARLGEILVEQGNLTRLDLAGALAEQWSTLQKLRPPAPAANRQPWQNGAPTIPSAASAPSDEDRPAAAALEQRLRTLEDAQGTSPWQDELQRVATELEVALAALEARIEAAAPDVTRSDLTALLAAVSARLDALEARPEHSDESALVERESLTQALLARVEEITATVPREDELAALRLRLDELAARPNETPALLTRIDEIASRLAGLDVLVGDVAEIRESFARLDAVREGDALATEARLDALEARPERSDESVLVERESLTQEFLARVDEIMATVPREDELAALRLRLDELAAHQNEPAALLARIDEVASRLAGLDAVEGDVAQIRESFARLDAVREGDALGAVSARLDALEARPERSDESVLVDLESLTQELLARVEELTATVPREDELAALRLRLDELAERPNDSPALLPRIDEIAGQLSGIEADVAAAAAATAELDSSAAELRSTAAELRGELEQLAARPTVEDPGARLDELSQTIDLAAREAHDRIDEIAGRLAGLGAVEGDVAEIRESFARIDAVREGDALATGARFAAIEADVAAAAAATAELHSSAAEVRSTAAELRGELEELAARPTVEDPGARLDELSRRIDLAAREAHERIDEIAGRLAGLGAVEGDVAEIRESFARIDAVREGDALATGARFAGLEADVAAAAAATAELHSSAAEVRSTAAELRGELEELAARPTVKDPGGRLDELSRRIDLAAREAHDRIDALTPELEAREARFEDRVERLLEEHAGAARAAAAELSTRLESLVDAVRADAVGARSDAEALRSELAAVRAEAAEARGAAAEAGALVAALRDERAGELRVAELATAQLAARLDEHVSVAAAPASEVVQSLRDELNAVAARLEESDAGGIESREELRMELERVASSVGSQLERIEEALAATDTTELSATVAGLARELERQAALGDEQVRVTERALRKGLATLGKNLAATESAYVDAGASLRRSIERLGAAVVEADVRIDGAPPLAAAAEGCVAFAPTAAGYRLVEIPGTPPELGATIELEGCDGPLVVTRYGRSPLPLDTRPCAYLDRA